MNKLYRYHDSHYWLSSSELFLQTRLYCYELEVDKLTKCGCWIYDIHHRYKFVLLSGKKRYAYPTKEEALESFKRRKAMQIKILTRQLAQAKNALRESNCKDNLI